MKPGRALCALAACAALAFGAEAHADGRVGVLLDADDPSDAQRLEAMRAAARDFNAARGPDGFRIELLLYDTDHGSALEGLRDAYAGGAGPSVYVGLTRGDDAEQVFKYLEHNSLVLISPSLPASSMDVQDGLFRLTPQARWEAGALAQLISDSGAKTAVVALHDGPTGIGDLEHVKQGLKKHWITVNGVVDFSADGSDWPLALGLLDVEFAVDPGAALVLLAGADSDVASMASAASGYRHASSAEWFVPGGAVYPAEGAPAPDVSITALTLEAGGNPVSDRVDYLMREAGREPSVRDYSAYDSVFVAGAALEAGGDVRARIPGAALALSGALGDIELDEAGDLSSPVAFGVWKSDGGAWSRSGQYDVQEEDCPSLDVVAVERNLDGRAVCVAPLTAKALEARGWGTPSVDMGLLGNVKVGNLVPLSGELTVRGPAALAAANLSAGEFNNLLDSMEDERWRLDLFTVDAGSDPDAALRAAQLIRSMGITALVDHGDGAKAVKEYADGSNMLVISCCSTAPDLAISGDSLYRVMPDDTNEAAALSALLEHNGIERAVAAWPGDARGDLMAEAWKGAAGETAAGEVRYDPGPSGPASAARELASQVRAASGQVGSDRTAVVLLGSDTADIASASLAYPDLVHVRWYGAGAAYESVQSLPAETAGFLASVQFTTTDARAAPSEIVHLAADRAGKDPSGFSGDPLVQASYDAVYLMGLSILEAGSSQGEDLRRAVRGAADGERGSVGYMTLNASGDLVRAEYDFWQAAEWGRQAAGSYLKGTFVPPVLVTFD